jgi:hypothetical protein
MHTFPATANGLNLQKQAFKPGPQRIIPRPPVARARRFLTRFVLWATAAVMIAALSGCSAVRLAYGQGPSLAYWWIDDFVDLTDAQSTILRKDIDRFFNWHRTQELPQYTERLRQWQSMASQDTTADQSCQQFDILRAAYQRSADRSLDVFVRLALSLQPDQLQHLMRHHTKSNQKFKDEWLEDGVQAQHNRLFDKTLDRYETLYGNLSADQQTALRARIKSSAFDPQRVQAERQRRQADLLDTVKQVQEQPAQAATLLRQWHARVLNSPDPQYAAYAQTLIREGCEQYAALHNTTNPLQRAHAVRTLKQYEHDLMALQRPD